MKKIVSLCVFLISLWSFVYGAPRLVNASIRQGSGLLKLNESQAILTWRLENPDDTEQKVMLQIKPENGRNAAIYSREYVLPAHSGIGGSTEIVAEVSDRFIMELLQNGNRIDKDDFLVHSIPNRRFQLAVLDDSYQFSGYGDIQKAQGLDAQIGGVTFRFGSVPGHWSEYSPYAAIALVNPAFASYTAANYQAIRDYVNQGGLLLIASPKIVPEILATPLGDMLPCTPLDSFTYPDLTQAALAFGMAAYKPLPAFDEDGFPCEVKKMPFRNLLPHADACVSFEMDGRPALVFRRHGAGSVAVLAFEPFLLSRQEPALIPQIWNPVIALTAYATPTMTVNTTRLANQTLQMLHGYSIPSVSRIAAILLVYIIGSGLILFFTFRKRRHATGWFGVCAFGILITVFVMASARKVAASKAECGAAVISLRTWEGAEGAVQADTLFLSKRDLQPQVSANAEQTFLFPQPAPTIFQAESAMPTSPLWIISDGNTIRLEKFTLQEMRPRSFRWATTGAKAYGANPGQLPVLHFLETGAQLEEWALPEALRESTRALLVTPESYRHLDISGGMVKEQGTAALLEADTVFTSVCNYLKGLRLAHPCLVLVQNKQNVEEPVQALLKGVPVPTNDYCLTIVPTEIKKDVPNYRVQPEFFTISIPEKSFLRSFCRLGEWHPISLMGRNSAAYELDFCLSPDLIPQSPETLEVMLDYHSSSNKFNLTVELRDVDGRVLEPVSADGGKYRFDIKGRNIIAPRTGHIRVALMGTFNNDVDVTAATRTLFWQIHFVNATLY